MEQPFRKLSPNVPVVQYDISALQVKLMSLALMVDDLEKMVIAQALRIQALEERSSWETQR